MLRRSHVRRVGGSVVAVIASMVLIAACSSSSSKSSSASTTSNPNPGTKSLLRVSWMPGLSVPGTPARYNQVGVIKLGPAARRTCWCSSPGRRPASAYFLPLAKWVLSKTTGWQIWSVERRQNLLEDQSQLSAFKQGKTTSTQVYNYYLGYLKNSSVANHFQSIPNSSVAFAKQWGMNVAVEDLHRVIGAAKQRGGKVVLGGHSLGGSVVTAYATWNFNGRAGADDLAGLVYIDGGSGPSTMTAAQASQQLQALNAPSASPWLSFGGISAPFAGLYNATGSLAALLDPNTPSLGQTSGLLPSNIVPPVRATNVGQYGFALNVATSPASLAAAQAHLGTGLAAAGPVHGWNGAGALTPITRYATMFSGRRGQQRRRHRVVLPPAPDQRHRSRRTTETQVRPRTRSTSTRRWATNFRSA